MVVSNIIENPTGSTTTWTRVLRLARYVLGLDLGPSNEKCLASAGAGFVGRTPEEKIYEMQVAASSAIRSRDPVYHQVLTWPEYEELSADRFREIVSDYIEFYKLQGQQVIFGLHQNTANIHFHIVGNKYDIETGRMIQINNGFERLHAALFCCFLEDKYGYEPSENAMAYKIGDELVLSDFYKVESARNYIDKKEGAFGIESAAKKVSRIVKNSLKTVSNWAEFQEALFRQNVTVTSGPRSGLVYLSSGAGEDIHVASSRVSVHATRKALSHRFGADFDESFVPGQIVDAPTGVGVGGSVELDAAPGAGIVDDVDLDQKYRRYSQPRSESALVPAALEMSVDQLSALFPKSHILFDKKTRGDGRRVHVVDRARGDASALSRDELLELLPNISRIVEQSSELRFKPADANLGARNIALVGPPAALQGLHAQGLFPGIVQDIDTDETRYVFLNVPADDGLTLQKLRAVAAELRCRFELEPALVLSRQKKLLKPKIDPVLLQPPELIQRLIPPSDLQFVYRFDDIKSELAGAFELVSASGGTGIRALSHVRRLKSCLSQLDLSSITLRGTENAETDRRGRDGRVDGPELASELQPVALRSLIDDRSDAGAGGDGEGQRSDAGEVRRSDRLDQASIVVKLESEEALGEAGIRREIGNLSTSGVFAREVGSENHDEENRSLIEAAGDFARKPENASRGAGHAAAGFRAGPAQLTPAWRMLRCLQVARRNNLDAHWDDGTTDILFFERGAKTAEPAPVPALVRVTETDIIGDPEASEVLLHNLQSVLPLPVNVPERVISFIDVASEDPTGSHGQIVTDKLQTQDDAPVHDDRDYRYAETSTQVLTDRPRPHDLVYDPDFLIGPKQLPDGYVCVNSRDALSELDLSELQQLIFVVDDKLGGSVRVDTAVLRVDAEAAGVPPDLEIALYMPEAVMEHAPEILVFVFEPDDELIARGPHPDHPEMLLVPARSGEPPDCAGISLENLKQVVLHLQESDDAPDSDSIDAVNRLRAQLEGWLQPPLLSEAPDIMESDGDYADAPWPHLGGDSDTDFGFPP